MMTLKGKISKLQTRRHQSEGNFTVEIEGQLKPEQERALLEAYYEGKHEATVEVGENPFGSTINFTFHGVSKDASK